jgi:hypothetical protein
MSTLNAIIGYDTLVGSNLLQFYKFDNFYNSNNFKDAKNKSFDIMYFCNIPYIKLHSNKYSDEYPIVIKNIIDILDTINVNKFILISTIDVYKNVNSQLDEDYKINFNENNNYSKNIFLFEEYIKNRYQDHYIIRLPKVFGHGLKKNIIYDLIHNNNVNNISLNSIFQWYYLDWLKNDIDIILKNNIRVCNFFTEPVNTYKIIKVFKNIYEIDYEFQIEYLGYNNSNIKYDMYSKYSHFFGNDKKYIRKEIDILNSLSDYLKFEKINKSNLCISNICINNISQFQFSCLVNLFGITKVQISFTKLIELYDNIDINKINFDIYKNSNLDIYSLKYDIYKLNDLNIFDDYINDKLFSHFKKIIDFSEKNNIKILIFGCPNNMKVLDINEDNNTIFIKFFKKISDYCNNKNIIICLENNSKKYNSNFMNSIEECSNLVRKINKINIKMMINLGNAVIDNDHWYYLKEYIDIIYNIDISHENMKNFLKIHESNYIFKFILDHNNYNKIINLEMLIKENNEIEILNNSLKNFIKIYGNNNYNINK